jgi:hypothetical protein
MFVIFSYNGEIFRMFSDNGSLLANAFDTVIARTDSVK